MAAVRLAIAGASAPQQVTAVTGCSLNGSLAGAVKSLIAMVGAPGLEPGTR
jgi:hypothetical protein